MNWINANEKLPEKRECVLAVVWGSIGEYLTVNGVYAFAAHDGERWYTRELDAGTDLQIDRVTFWMPLPEPPTAAEEKANAALAALMTVVHGDDPCAVCAKLDEQEHMGCDAACVACWIESCGCCGCIQNGYSKFEWSGRANADD